MIDTFSTVFAVQTYISQMLNHEIMRKSEEKN